MIVGRIIGWLLLLAALGCLVREGIDSFEAKAYEMFALGELWFEVHKDSLQLAQPAIQRYVHPRVWDPMIVTVLRAPAWAVFAAPGLLLLVLCRRRNKVTEMGSGWHDKENLEYMSDVNAATQRRGSRFAYILTIFVAIFFVVFILWADFAELEEVTRGDGTVIPSSKTQVIQNLEGGILAEILIREGDIVQRGDILVRIDNTVAQATYNDARGQYNSLRATISRLTAELEDTELSFPPDVEAEAPEEVADQRSLYSARKRQMEAQVSVLKAQAFQRRQEIKEMRSRRSQLSNSLALAREEQTITAPLAARGVVPRLDLLRIDRQVADLEGEIGTIGTSLPRLQNAVKEAEQRIDELVLTAKAELSDQLNQAKAQLKSVAETLFAGKDRVTRTEVRSPVHGTVKEIKHNTVGGVIRPGEDIMEIVPLDDSLLIEASIRPADIAFLRPGQKAVIKVTAYDFSIFGGLDADLEQISASTIKDEAGESFYRVYLRTDRNTLVHNDEDLPIIPGMTATVEILTGKKSVLDYIMKPILKAQNRALRER